MQIKEPPTVSYDGCLTFPKTAVNCPLPLGGGPIVRSSPAVAARLRGCAAFVVQLRFRLQVYEVH